MNEVEPPITSGPAIWTVHDTVTIKGKLCQRFTAGKFSTDILPPLYEMYVYEDSGVVYWFRPKLDIFTVLYDFNKTIGESWLIQGVQTWRDRESDTNGCDLVARVMAKGVDTINGFPLRTVKIEVDPFSGYIDGFNGKVIEYIGSMNCPRPNPYRSCNGMSETSDLRGLRCFNHMGIGFHNFIAPEDCNYTSVKEIQQEIVTLTPNPGTGLYQLDMAVSDPKPTTLKIYDLTGRLLLRQELHSGANTIDITFCTPGLYLYQLVQNGMIEYNGKLVRQ